MSRDKLDIAKAFMGERAYNSIIKTYPESTRKVMSNEFHRLEKEHPHTIRKLNSCKYNMDTRTIEQYARDLSVAWVVEDYARKVMGHFSGYKILNSGGDSNREFQSTGRVSSAADFVMVGDDGEKISIEFITDYHGYYSKNGFFHLRNNKLPNLLKEAKKRRVMILSMNLKDKTFFIEDVRNLNYTRSESWGKPTSKVVIDFEEHKLTKANIAAQMKKAGRSDITI